MTPTCLLPQPYVFIQDNRSIQISSWRLKEAKKGYEVGLVELLVLWIFIANALL